MCGPASTDQTTSKLESEKERFELAFSTGNPIFPLSLTIGQSTRLRKGLDLLRDTQWSIDVENSLDSLEITPHLVAESSDSTRGSDILLFQALSRADRSELLLAEIRLVNLLSETREQANSRLGVKILSEPSPGESSVLVNCYPSEISEFDFDQAISSVPIRIGSHLWTAVFFPLE